MRLVHRFAGFVVIAALLGSVAPVATAANYTVSTNPYSANRTLLQSDLWDTHELIAQNGQTIAYSMTVTTAGGCLQLLLVRGHNANTNSQFYTAYSQENCVTSYSSSFSVGSGDGIQFTVLLATTQSVDVAYTVTISVTTPAIPSWVLGLLILIVIIFVPTIVLVLLRRAKRARMAPIAPPPPYPGAPGAPMVPPPPPPAAPPAQPPQEPWPPRPPQPP